MLSLNLFHQYNKITSAKCPNFDVSFDSDVTVKLQGHDMHGHKFVLAAHSDEWGVKDLQDAPHLDLTGKDCNRQFCAKRGIQKLFFRCGPNFFL